MVEAEAAQKLDSYGHLGDRPIVKRLNIYTKELKTYIGESEILSNDK